MDFNSLFGSASESSGSSLVGKATSASTGIDGLFPSLSMKQRIIGFVFFFCVGMLVSFLSTINIMHPVTFGIMYTFGNICALFSTAFLFGPLRQLKNMFALKRLTATLVYFGALIGTLLVAFMTKNVIGTLIMIGVQFLALVWYTLSYIPYARDLVKTMFSNCFK